MSDFELGPEAPEPLPNSVVAVVRRECVVIGMEPSGPTMVWSEKSVYAVARAAIEAVRGDFLPFLRDPWRDGACMFCGTEPERAHHARCVVVLHDSPALPPRPGGSS